MAPRNEPIRVGEIAPEFTLKDQHNNDVTLSSYRGKKAVVLAFYPFDWSPICTPENQCLTRDLDQFTGTGAEVLGISCDSMWSHKAFADAYGIKHRLLADLQREVCRAYGLFHPDLNAAQRATVVIDKTGHVAWVKVQELKNARDDQEILSVIKNQSRL